LLSLLDQADTGLACAHDLPEGGRIIVGSGQRSAVSIQPESSRSPGLAES
jgi:hypothetical protein